MSANAVRKNLILIAVTTIALFGILWLSPQTSFAEEQNSEEPIVLNVYVDDTLAEDFTEAELNAIWQGDGEGKYYDYSAFNANETPSFKLTEGAGGPEVEEILKNAGIELDVIDKDQVIEFISGGDGVRARFLKGQLFQERYFYPNAVNEYGRAGKAPEATSWNNPETVPVILSLEADDSSNERRLLFGQISPNEQTHQASIQYLIGEVDENNSVITAPGSIIVHSETGNKLNPIKTTNLGATGTFKKGSVLTFDRSVNAFPAEWAGVDGRYTIYFTTDGTEPDPASKTSQIYNYNNNLFNKPGEKINKPIIPNGKITIKTKVVGYGMQDSEPSEFTFTGVTPPGKVAGVKIARASYQSLRITWYSVSGASGYQVGRYDSSKNAYVPVKSVSSESALTYTNSGLKTGTAYYYRVRAYKTVNGKTFYGSWSDKGKGTPILSKTTISNITAKRKALALTWKKVAGANGYQIYRATKKTGSYKLVKTISKQGTVNWTNKNLKGKKTYWYKIRVYRVVSGKRVYSSFSAVKYKKTR